MKEIKFRAWHLEEMKMCRAGLINFDNDFVFLDGVTPDQDQSVLDDEGQPTRMTVIALKNGRACQLKTIKLMQYTGLKDKNGVEIYEGDIVIINEHDDDWTDTVVSDKNFLELSKYRNKCVTNISLYEYHKTIRVIGNIYENPDL